MSEFLTSEQATDEAWRIWNRKRVEGSIQNPKYFDPIPGPCHFSSRKDIRFPLYRYMERQYAEEFLTTGTLRLKPVYSYRHDENPKIRDDLEGQMNFSVTVANSTALGGRVPVAIRISITNQWCLCTSEVRDYDKMIPAFGNCGLRINSIEFFLKMRDQMAGHCHSCLLDRVVYVPPNTWGVDADELPEGHTTFGGLFKRDCDSFQREVRFLAERPNSAESGRIPTDISYEEQERGRAEFVQQQRNGLSPIFIKVPKAIPYCELP